MSARVSRAMRLNLAVKGELELIIFWLFVGAMVYGIATGQDGLTTYLAALFGATGTAYCWITPIDTEEQRA